MRTSRGARILASESWHPSGVRFVESPQSAMSAAISIENVSKMYRLGQVGTGTVAHDLNRWWARFRGRDDPYSRVGQVNDRSVASATPAIRSSPPEYVWALKDINLQVEQGQILGIIGRNGAGKSTLLKLLSRVTAPTAGRIRVRGRMASLLEVGTGFHPELTGRENIYLNGAILGMTRSDIRRRFDEIVEFSGCAKYIDTPVKRYSSGMYVRLAFAVAAHLEPEILIVDEVLAVGDADFQARCIGKMEDVSRESGRTILFVSHNMASIRRLCRHSCLLVNGTLDDVGPTSEIIDRYLAAGTGAERILTFPQGEEPAKGGVRLMSVSILDSLGRSDTRLSTSDSLRVEVRYTLEHAIRSLRVSVNLFAQDGSLVFSTSDFNHQAADRMRAAGSYMSSVILPAHFLNIGKYQVSVDIDIPLTAGLVSGHDVVFHVDELIENHLGLTHSARPAGAIHPRLDWQIQYSPFRAGSVTQNAAL